MPKPKWSTFAESKEYLIWCNIESVCKEYNLSGDNYVTRLDIGGECWEPLLDRILKLGVTLKCVPKAIKDIKMDWMRPLLYLESQSQEKVVYDGETYLVNKGAIGLATTLRFAFKRLLDSMVDASNINEENFVKESKTMKENVKYFFKCLAAYVKDGYRAMHENVKLILKPLRMLRKSAYRLFSLEKAEENNVDLTMFKDKKSLVLFMNNIKDMFKWDEFKIKRDNGEKGEEMLKEFLDKNTSQDALKYTFRDEKREVEVNKENPYDSIAKKDLNKSKDNKDGRDKMSIEDKMKLKELQARHKLIYPNIDNLEQEEPNRFIKEAMQKDFEDGIDAMIIYLNKKMEKDFPYLINAHKIFININDMPKAKENKATSFYINDIIKVIYQMKVKCYEMKLNGLSRIKMPITENKEIISIIKNVYDLHITIDTIMGNVLLHEQFLFFYNKIKDISESNLKEELEIIKDKNFIEKGVVKYLIFEAMCKSVECYSKMVIASKKNSKHFNSSDYFQLSKLSIDIDSNNEINYYDFEMLNEKKRVRRMLQLPKEQYETFIQNEKIYKNEINTYGRFFLLEGFIPPKEKDKYISIIDMLNEINPLVREDIRNYLLTSTLPSFENENNNSTNNNITLNNATSKNSSKNASRISSRVNSPKGSKRTLNTKKRLKTPKRNAPSISKRKKSESVTSEESEEKSKILNAKVDSLRPPLVWNYPVDRLTEMQNDIKKENNAKNKKGIQNITPLITFRSVDPRNSYVDGRVGKFINVFDNFCDVMLEYCKNERKDSFDYLVDKVFNIFNIKYNAFKRFDEQVHEPFAYLKEDILFKRNDIPVQEIVSEDNKV